jgi:hypothetical protein
MFGLDGPDEAESSSQAQRRLSDAGSEDDEGEGEEFQSDDGWGADDGFVSDSEDEMVAAPEPKRAKVEMAVKVPEVVYADSRSGGSLDALSKAEKRAFLVCQEILSHGPQTDDQNGTSAKMMGIKHEPDYVPRKRQRQTAGDDEEDDQ